MTAAWRWCGGDESRVMRVKKKKEAQKKKGWKKERINEKEKEIRHYVCKSMCVHA